MSEGLLDTSVVVDLRSYVDRADLLPDEAYVSALTLAEVVQGPLFARTDTDRRRVPAPRSCVNPIFPTFGSHAHLSVGRLAAG
jgi:predicted nucleic acid-binding protein